MLLLYLNFCCNVRLKSYNPQQTADNKVFLIDVLYERYIRLHRLQGVCKMLKLKVGPTCSKLFQRNREESKRGHELPLINKLPN